MSSGISCRQQNALLLPLHIAMKEMIDFEDVFQCASNSIIVTDKSGIIIHINQKAAVVLELNSSVDHGRDIKDLLPVAGGFVQKCLQTGCAIIGSNITENRTQLIFDVTPAKRENVLLGTVCSFQELSLLELSAKETNTYQELNRQLETIFHSSSDGIWVCDGDGCVISINRASEKLNGIKASAVIGENVDNLLASKIFDQSVTSKVMASKSRETVMQYIAKTGRFLLSTGTPSLDEEGNIVLIVINERDMTELNTLRKQFEQSQKVKEKYKEELSELSLLELDRNSIIAESSKMRHILQMSLKLSHIGASNILILGESGTGKGLLAKQIHKNSTRRKKPFIEINCAALPEYLLEAELFGYEKGAFTGASEKGKVGLLELAQGGTLFLDEIGDMPVGLQSKLLKYLDNQEIRRVGGTESIKITCATVAATNQNLGSLVKQKLFREDFYYRLSSFILEIPPLKERIEDISGLIRFYLNEFNQKYQCSRTISPRAIKLLQKYSFPGNIRELKSMIENAVVMSETNYIDKFVQTSVIAEKPTTVIQEMQMISGEHLAFREKLAEFEKQLLLDAKMKYRTTREIAVNLGISQPSVVRKLNRYKIS